jgi:uncharacterized protein YndB with AHSA1/START domain
MSEMSPKPRSVWPAILKWTLLIIGMVVVAVTVMGLFVLDGKYDVSREIVIQAPPAEIHKQVGDLDQWPNWLPFTKHDKSVKTTVEKATGVGASQHWTGNDGTGKLTFTESDPEKGIEYTMLFDEKWASKGSMTYAKVGENTRVTWRMTGQNDDFIGKWMAAGMNYMVGSKFDEGLADLKKKVEQK